MAQIRSFRDFIENHHYNNVFKALSEFVAENPDRLDVHSYKVQRPDEAELADMNIRRVDVRDATGNKISFDVVAEAELTISETVRRNKESDDKEQWFRIACSADVEFGKFHNFDIKSASVYDKRNTGKTDILSDKLVPIIAKENFDDVAEEFLSEFYPEALKAPTPIDVVEIVNRMRLELKETRLTRYYSLFGQMVFSDCEVDVYDDENRNYVPLAVKRGTILVDPNVYFMRNIGSYNNTIIHECIHWYKHRKYHWLAQLYRSDSTHIRCKVDEKYDYRYKKQWSDWDWMEWHANGVAPRVLMPRTQTMAKIEELIAENSKYFDDRLTVLESVVYELSVFFNVSKLAAKIRMLDLGYKDVEGVLTYVDDRYIPNYAFRADSKERNQTYSIGLEDSFHVYYTSPEFRKFIDSGCFVYIDAHFVLRDEKYIQPTENGGLTLTDYAKANIHECCLRFDQKLRKVDYASGVNYLNNIMFNLAVSVICDPLFNIDNHNMDFFNRSDELKKFHTDLLADGEFIQSQTKNFCQLAWAHLERCRCVYKEVFREKTLLSDKTFDRIKKGDLYKPDVDTIMALCFGLNLGAVYGFPLLNSAGYDFTHTQVPQYVVYRLREQNETTIKQLDG